MASKNPIKRKKSDRRYYLGHHKRILCRERKKYKELSPEQKRIKINYELGRRKQHKAEWMVILHNNDRDYCSICGYSKCFAAIDYHHPVGVEKINVAFDLLRQKPTTKRVSEMLLLTPVCANCHREIHWLKE